MKQEKWVWMGHAGHFILGDRCQFRLCTYVGRYIVSTVGELWNPRASREIHANVYDPQWLTANRGLQGDSFDSAYMARFGYEDIGHERKYETMVFRAKKDKGTCCPYRQGDGGELDFCGYNKAEDAHKGHIRMCKKWSKKHGTKNKS
jgi:hypothetical protein